ncbi:MAG: zinc finger Ran-binding domain-containing protein [Pyrinomonadaceae bacterium]
MKRNKCARCGVVNFASDQKCRRCGATLGQSEPVTIGSSNDGPTQRRKGSILRRLTWIVGLTVAILFIWYASLRITSEPLRPEHETVVTKAVDVLEASGFDNEVFLLRNLVTYRSTDSWWNKYVGHRDAYVATNFPFEILTLYPQFFENSTDDNERAAMLLHEAYHLFGSGEEKALERVWRQKQRLSWTSDKYSHSQVWNNTRELTMSLVPSLFQCGPERRSDCID